MIKKIGSIIALVLTLAVVGQKKRFSPYSAFGIGDQYKSKTVEQASMSGIGVALQDNKSLNFVNPAALSKLQVTTFSFAARTTFQELIKSSSTQKMNSSGLNYIALGFPLGKKAGVSVDLQPKTSVDYSLFSQDKDENGNVSSSTRLDGSGGTNTLSLSFGLNVFKGLSLGVKTSYVFGNIDKLIVNSQEGSFLGTKYSKESHISGSQFKFGAHYQTNLSERLKISTGVAVRLVNKITSTDNERMYSFTYQGGKEVSDDDLYYPKDVKNVISEPMSIVVGFGLGVENNWYVGLNSDFIGRNHDLKNQNNINFNKSTSTSIGGYYIPKINSITSYWNRVTYRGGIKYEKTGISIKDPVGDSFSSLNDFGMNLGLSLPLPKSVSSINLGVEYGVKATTIDILTKERYFNLRLGLSLNSFKWFRKRQID